MLDMRKHTVAAVATLGLLVPATALAATVNGGPGNEKLRGTNGPDQIDGNGGNDRIHGRAGDDRLIGGPGRDVLRGGAGRDSIDARDGTRDLVVCGAGRDVARVDARDRVRGCERVIRPKRR